MSKKPKPLRANYFKFESSELRYTVYKSPINEKPRSLNLILEGNRIDDLGYQIYKSFIADLDKIDILIRDKQTGETMKIVKGGKSESMIGVILSMDILDICHSKL